MNPCFDLHHKTHSCSGKESLQAFTKFILVLVLLLLLSLSGASMKVHPAPKKRNIALRYAVASALSERDGVVCRQKKLRRLPHIFARVLELPFHSDADVSVQETPDSFRFAAPTDAVGRDVRTETIEIHPGVMKIVIRGSNLRDLTLDELEIDMWRFRLPASTRPELASAMYDDGELVVTVPKGGVLNDPGGDEQEEVWADGATRFVLVQ